MKIIEHQYDGVQALRFFAAMLVVITHSFFYTGERLGGALSWGNGARGVDIFFVISGFVMIIASRNLMNTPDGWLRFLVQRITRVVPLYWVATTLKVLVMLAVSGLVIHAQFDFAHIAKSYMFIPYEKSSGKIEPILGVGWTLIFEMFFYLIFTLALLVRANVYVFVGLVMVVFASLSLVRPEHHAVWMYLFDPIVLEFYFGMLIGRETLAGRKINLFSAYALLTLTAFMILILPSSGLTRVVVAGIPAAILVYSIVSIESVLRDKIPRTILYFGAASYSLYLFHPLVLPGVPVILNKLHFNYSELSIFLCIVLALATAAVVYRFIEIPIAHLIRRYGLASTYAHKPVIESK